MTTESNDKLNGILLLCHGRITHAMHIAATSGRFDLPGARPFDPSVTLEFQILDGATGSSRPTTQSEKSGNATKQTTDRPLPCCMRHGEPHLAVKRALGRQVIAAARAALEQHQSRIPELQHRLASIKRQTQHQLQQPSDVDEVVQDMAPSGRLGPLIFEQKMKKVELQQLEEAREVEFEVPQQIESYVLCPGNASVIVNTLMTWTPHASPVMVDTKLWPMSVAVGGRDAKTGKVSLLEAVYDDTGAVMVPSQGNLVWSWKENPKCKVAGVLRESSEQKTDNMGGPSEESHTGGARVCRLLRCASGTLSICAEPPLPVNKSMYWRIELGRIADLNVLLGVCSSSEPPLATWREPGVYGWQSSKSIAPRAFCNGMLVNAEDWSGFRDGDIAHFEYNGVAGQLCMRVDRLGLGRVFVLECSPTLSTAQSLHIHINVQGDRDPQQKSQLIAELKQEDFEWP